VCCEVAATGCDQVNLVVDKFRSQRWQPIMVTLGPVIFDRDVLTLDIASLA
jgi:hypothetical protein